MNTSNSSNFEKRPENWKLPAADLKPRASMKSSLKWFNLLTSCTVSGKKIKHSIMKVDYQCNWSYGEIESGNCSHGDGSLGYN